MDSRLPNTDSSRRSIISKVNLCFVDEYFARDHICFVRCSQLRQRRASRSRRRRQLDDESSDDDDFFMFTAAATVQMLSTKKTNHVLDSCSTSIPTLNFVVHVAKLVNILLNSRPPMHNRSLCPSICRFLVSIKIFLNSIPKFCAFYIGPVNGIFASIQPN